MRVFASPAGLLRAFTPCYALSPFLRGMFACFILCFKDSISSKVAYLMIPYESGSTPIWEWFEEHYNEWPKKKKKKKERTTSWFWMSGLCASWHSPWVETSRLWLWMEATEDYMSSWFLSLRGLLMLVLKWKKHKWRLQMGGTRNGGLPKGRDVLSNLNRLLSCECFLMFWVTDFSLCFFALDCAVAAKWKNFMGLLAAPSICYCCLTAVITNIVIMVIIIIIS